MKRCGIDSFFGNSKRRSGATFTSSKRNHVEWVAESLKAMQSVKVGMTRGDLEKVL